MADDIDDDDELDMVLDDERVWPLTWRPLLPRERWLWFERLWSDVLALRERYLLPVRNGWWESEVQVETLAALAATVALYDTGEWATDPASKLELLSVGLERVGTLLRGDGHEPFHPDRDRTAYVRFVVEERGAQVPPNYEPERTRDGRSTDM